MADAVEPIPEIESPCIGVCALDDQGTCIGCFRTRQEIAGWLSLAPEERRSIIDALPGRGQQYFDGD